jgi:uncharacterized protein YoxC
MFYKRIFDLVLSKKKMKSNKLPKKNRNQSKKKFQKFPYLPPSATVLILLGFIFLLRNYGVINLDKLWPVFLIISGILIYVYWRQNKISHEAEATDSQTNSFSNVTQIDPDLLRDIERTKLTKSAKKDILDWIRDQAIFILICLAILGLFGVQGYVDSLFSPIREEIDSIQQKFQVVDSLAQMTSNLKSRLESSITETEILERRTNLLKNDINGYSNITQQLTNELSRKKDEYKKINDQMNELVETSIQKTNKFIENRPFTIIIKHNRINEKLASYCKQALLDSGFRSQTDLLSDKDANTFQDFSNIIFYHDSSMKEKAGKIKDLLSSIVKLKKPKYVEEGKSRDTFIIWLTKK